MTLHLCGQVYREGKWDQLPGDAIVPGDLVSIGRPSGLLPACLGFGVRGSGFRATGVASRLPLQRLHSGRVVSQAATLRQQSPLPPVLGHGRRCASETAD